MKLTEHSNYNQSGEARLAALATARRQDNNNEAKTVSQISQEFVEVTRDQFFAAMGLRNVHPRAERTQSTWIDQSTHAVLGVSTPGYMCDGGESYKLAPALVRAL